jgi:hypothetical protein
MRDLNIKSEIDFLNGFYLGAPPDEDLLHSHLLEVKARLQRVLDAIGERP